MTNLKYKVGDRVLIKDIGWYNKNKNEDGDVSCGEFNFVEGMKKYCSETFTILDDDGDYYLMMEDYLGYMWTDEMIEGLVEEETKPKFKVGDKVILDPYPCVVTDVNWRDSLHGFVYTVRGTDFGKMVGEEDLIFDTSEETPKFKVNDIVFVKNIGWVRITNSYWDSLANEYIYEAIGFNGEGEYDYITQSNIEDQMLPESENPHTGGNKITLEEYKNNDKEWLFNKLAMLDNITALESIQDIFNHLQQSKYPKTYEECCEIISSDPKFYVDTHLYSGILGTLYKLLVCRDAYWKLYGEEMGLGKPWEPDWSIYEHKFCLGTDKDRVIEECVTTGNRIFAFPTEEMRDAFYENFKKEIEICKKLL